MSGGGWDDDDDLLDAMLDDADGVEGGGVGGEAGPPPSTGAGVAVAVDEGGDEGGDAAADGWGDDDDLELESTSEEGEAVGKEGTAGQAVPPRPPVAPPPPPPPTAAEASPPPPPSLHALLAAHEQIMDRAIATLDDFDGGRGEAAADDDAADEWDFDDDDDDIFHEGSPEGHASVPAEEAALDPMPRQPLAGNPFLADAANENEHGAGGMPPPAYIPNDNGIPNDNDNGDEDAAEEAEEWEFEDDDEIFNEGDGGLGLDADADKKEEPRHATEPKPEPQPILENPFLKEEVTAGGDAPAPTSTPAANGAGNAVHVVEDADEGWSDEDFFDDDEIDAAPSTSSSSPHPNTVPPPPPQPVPTPVPRPPPAVAAASPPIAQRTRAKRAHQQMQPKPSSPIPPTVPPPIPPAAPALNPSQRRIHTMLTSYISSLGDPAFLGRLRQKLHRGPTAPSSAGTHGNGGHGATPAKNAAADLKKYYAARPGLRKYTLGVELDRMDYALILSNGKTTDDKDVIRSYFGVGADGERMHPVEEDEGEGEEATTTEELLVRSANQSLLADMLVALTGAEEDVVNNGDVEDDFFDQDEDDAGYRERKVQSTGLILAGPTLCMTSVAEACHFTVDLQRGAVEAVCRLAVSVPFHGDAATATAPGGNEDVVVRDGRLVLARATVSVRFRPGDEGGGDPADAPTVRYAVRSAIPLHAPDAPLLRTAAVSLARDNEDPFFHDDYAAADDDATADARDAFLLSHHLLSDAGLIAVSDRIDKLRATAAAGSTGFKSAWRELDAATNVSGKLQFLTGAAAGGGHGGGGGSSSGLGGFGLALPSAEEIEAAEREAAMGAQFANVPPPPGAGVRFPRPEGNVGEAHGARSVRPPPPPPPPVPPVPLQEEAARPRPLIGGLFMSGLSRLAAKAAQPDEQSGTPWEGGGGTGLTPPSSPPSNGQSAGARETERPTFYRREGDALAQPPLSGVQDGNEARGLTGLTSTAPSQPQHTDHFKDSTLSSTVLTEGVYGDEVGWGSEGDGVLEDTQDAGWSDDEFEFEDEPGRLEGIQEIECGESAKTVTAIRAPPIAKTKPEPLLEAKVSNEDNDEKKTVPQEPFLRAGSGTMTIPPPPPPKPPSQYQQTIQPQRTFEEEFVIVLKDRIEAEAREMKERGRMKRWTPIREDAALRKRLMEVMVTQINS